MAVSDAVMLRSAGGVLALREVRAADRSIDIPYERPGARQYLAVRRTWRGARDEAHHAAVMLIMTAAIAR